MASKTALMEKVLVISFAYSDGSGYRVIQAFKQELRAVAEAQLDILQNEPSDGNYKLSEIPLFGLKEVE